MHSRPIKGFSFKFLREMCVVIASVNEASGKISRESCGALFKIVFYIFQNHAQALHKAWLICVLVEPVQLFPHFL